MQTPATRNRRYRSQVSVLTSSFLQVAVPTPLYQVFDYRARDGHIPDVGVRVVVPFGRRQVVAVVVGATDRSEVPSNKLRTVLKVLDDQPIVPADLMELLAWASRYYHHPIGEVMTSALPVLLRREAPAVLPSIECYRWVQEPLQSISARAHVQRHLYERLATAKGEPLDAQSLSAVSRSWRKSLQPLLDDGAIERQDLDALPQNIATDLPPVLLDEQVHAVAAIQGALGKFQPFLLNGVTGSGKTEVYLQCIAQALSRGEQVLLLVPEISLTPQLMNRFQRRVSGCMVSLHSGLNDTERLQNWMIAAKGHADVVIGTRSAALVPMPRLGLIVVDEEHDGSLKQQDGFRYNARDFALMRAQKQQCPIVLGSATPSFESLNNVAAGRYQELTLSIRAGGAQAPALSLLDIRRQKLFEGLSERLLSAISEHLEAGRQALIFINRRGFAPTLLCNDCGASASCNRCDAHMTVHARRQQLRCHHCGAERRIPPACESCGSAELDFIGYGTERISNALQERFPDVPMARIDRDTTRNKGALESQLQAATSGEAKLLVGTQMLAKGHHFPGVTLVGILDADRGLFGTDFRSLEHMGQLVLQVAGRAGREVQRGEVFIQTRNPDNPMLQTLVRDGYPAFAREALTERKVAMLPPYAFVALVRAEATEPNAPHIFLERIITELENWQGPDLMIVGPAPAPMERRGGRYRAQLFIQAERRARLNACLKDLTAFIDKLPEARRTRWSIDVDPVDLF